MKNLTLLVLILILAAILRFYQLESIPAGLHGDGASQGYNAYSLLQTGKDRYGESFPTLFRAYGSYQPPIYTYLATIPVSIFGNSVFSARFISALSGVILVPLTYMLIYLLFDAKIRSGLAIVASLLVAIAPWSIFFSRLTLEANLAVSIFISSVLFFILSLRKRTFFPLACLLLGLSTHAYYSERVIAVLFLPIFLVLFKSIFLKNKRWIFFGLLIFIITQIPHFQIIQSGAFARRFDQVGIDSSPVSAGKIFLENFAVYYSPKNLFFDSDTNLGRTMPGLSVFYNILLIPFILGIRYMLKNLKQQQIKILGLLILITPIPAGVTGDTFYPLRTLDFLWTITILIAVGVYQLYESLKNKNFKILLTVLIIPYFLFSLYVSYFILFKYEKAENYGYPYIKLMDKLSEYEDKNIMKDKNIVIDLSRDLGVGVRLAYLQSYDPTKMQEQLRPQLKSSYYSSFVNADETYQINKITVKPINWGDTCKDIILVGDTLAISEGEVKEHKLKLEFEIPNITGKIALRGYSTNPKEKCPQQY